MSYFLIKTKNLELTRFEQLADINELKKTHLPFSGSLGQHPYDVNKVVLLSDPYTTSTLYYEFAREDIGLVEKLPNIINSEGEDVAMILLWIRKGRIGVRCAPFLVESVVHR